MVHGNAFEQADTSKWPMGPLQVGMHKWKKMQAVNGQSGLWVTENGHMAFAG